MGQCFLPVVWPKAKRIYASMLQLPGLLYSVAGHCQPMPLPETPGHSQSTLAQSLVGSLPLSPGSWCTQGFVFSLQEPISPVLWKFCNQIPSGLQSQILWGFSVPLPDPQDGESVVGPRTFATVRELPWYNCSPVCGSSAWWLCRGANGNLLQEDLCHTLSLPSLLHRLH